MTNTAGFDPQHDARFQRGFDPSAARAEEPGAALGLGPSADLPADAPYGSRATARAAAAPQERPTAGDFVRGTDGLDEAPNDEPLAPRRNPFVIALWVLGPLLLVGGFALIVQAAQNNGYSYNGSEIPWAIVLQQITWSLAPTMMAAGLSTIMGLLFWHAFAWHRARTGSTGSATAS
ncbi:hypothetical protein E3T55_17330 [Cryobacterium frigoriphilum]|uniref:Uncharacterized protein n=1 Tax=Cryobacterium frigoriphilum TaxID=1259150 RepID=A0A4R8ZUD9_9MICO|nr:hypothetical protein [Cryobacterium frigoriphilum]TFD46369.1 hypothetical protein E3T55_17330 [Cryobacterium frigoriphilum]